MVLTEVEKLLIGYLKVSGVGRGTSIAILMTLQSEEKMLEMCSYMAENEKAPEEELLNKAREIAAAR